jgi:glycosyltransferase involved in cell wall biosynthesis
MKLLIAPLHYIISDTTGSEFTRAYEYLLSISNDKDISGDALVGYSDFKRIGNFQIHNLLPKKPEFISIFLRLKFIILVFLKYLDLTSKNKYDCIWHQGPFAIDETFSLVSLWNRRKTRFIVGPIYTPLVSKSIKDFGISKNDRHGSVGKLPFIRQLDIHIYRKFAKILSFMSNLSLKQADKIITIEGAGRDMLYKRNIMNVEVIPLTVISNKFFASPRQKTDEHFSLLSVGYLLERKRTVDLIDAFNILIKKYCINNISLTVVGDGPEKQNVIDLITKHQLNDHVKLVGYVSRTEISKYFKAADIFLSASVSDSMPGVYFEAMSSALPMIIAHNTTAIDLDRNNFGGIVVPAHNPDKFAGAIFKLINNRKLYTQFSINNANLVKTTYNFDRSVGRLKQCFYPEYE